MGQAAPCRVFVAEGQVHRARWILSQRTLSDSELTFLATGEMTEEEGEPNKAAP
jgi:hypothetical protein